MVAMNIPKLRSDRLILCPPCIGHFETYCSFYADAEASSFYGGPLTPVQAWRKLAYDVGHWALRGFGMWSLVEQASSEMVGGCGILWPEGWPRHELTWWIMPGARRHGYAEAASRTVLRWARKALHWDVVETHMRDENRAAHRLAIKLGGMQIARERFPDGHHRDVYAIPTMP